MNGTNVLLGVLAVAAIGGVAYAATRDDEPEETTAPPSRTPRMPPINTVPPIVSPQGPREYQLPSVPPSDWPILGGEWIESIGKYCPPGYQYNGWTSMCDPKEGVIYVPSNIQPVTMGKTTTGACCDSCADGGPCKGCG